MSVRRAHTSDLAGIMALEVFFGPHERWTHSMWASELAWPDRRVVVVREGDEVLGAATFQLVGEVADLHRIVVGGPYQRGGLASMMLADGISWARTSGATRVLLEVRSDNEAALGLYRKYGFSVIAERVDYYAPGSDALVLELLLGGDEA